jgi:hypothetical protein
MIYSCKPVVLMASIVLLLFTACGINENKETTADIAVAESKQYAPAAANEVATADTTVAPAPAAGNREEQQKPGPPAANIDWDKKIIKNALLTVEVKNHKSFNDLVHDMVKRSGGYIAEEEQNKSDYKIENIVTIKVPVDQFDNLVKGITATKDNVVTQKITSQDVTGEVIDTKARIEAKRQIRLRYLELLKQAKNMEDILKVQDEINNIQEEIEAGSGRVNYLTHEAAFSTVHLTFYEILNAAAVDNSKPGFGQRVLNALGNGLEWVGEMLVVLFTLWPLWLILGGAWWAFRRWKTKAVKS